MQPCATLVVYYTGSGSFPLALTNDSIHPQQLSCAFPQRLHCGLCFVLCPSGLIATWGLARAQFHHPAMTKSSGHSELFWNTKKHCQNASIYMQKDGLPHRLRVNLHNSFRARDQHTMKILKTWELIAVIFTRVINSYWKQDDCGRILVRIFTSPLKSTFDTEDLWDSILRIGCSRMFTFDSMTLYYEAWASWQEAPSHHHGEDLLHDMVLRIYTTICKFLVRGQSPPNPHTPKDG